MAIDKNILVFMPSDADKAVYQLRDYDKYEGKIHDEIREAGWELTEVNELKDFETLLVQIPKDLPVAAVLFFGLFAGDRFDVRDERSNIIRNAADILAPLGVKVLYMHVMRSVASNIDNAEEVGYSALVGSSDLPRVLRRLVEV